MASPTSTGFYDAPDSAYQTTWYGQRYLPSSWNKDGGYNANRFRAASLDALGQEQRFGTQAEQDAYNQYKAFDPSQAFQSYYGGVLDETKNALGDALDQLTGRSVGAGRLQTGFFDRDAGDTVRRYLSDATAQGRQAALQTTGMRQQQLSGLLDFGQQARNRYLDLLSGNFDRQTGIQNSKYGFGDAVGDVLKASAMAIPFL